jgi:hypothetical protein
LVGEEESFDAAWEAHNTARAIVMFPTTAKYEVQHVRATPACRFLQEHHSRGILDIGEAFSAHHNQALLLAVFLNLQIAYTVASRLTLLRKQKSY